MVPQAMGHHNGPPAFNLTLGLAVGLAFVLLLLARYFFARKKASVD